MVVRVTSVEAAAARTVDVKRGLQKIHMIRVGRSGSGEVTGLFHRVLLSGDWFGWENPPCKTNAGEQSPPNIISSSGRTVLFRGTFSSKQYSALPKDRLSQDYPYTLQNTLQRTTFNKITYPLKLVNAQSFLSPDEQWTFQIA